MQAFCDRRTTVPSQDLLHLCRIKLGGQIALKFLRGDSAKNPFFPVPPTNSRTNVSFSFCISHIAKLLPGDTQMRFKEARSTS